MSAATTWDGPRDSDGEPCFYLNKYICDGCGTEWEDQWSCACNDKCPNCNAEIEPDSSEWLGSGEEPEE